MTRRAIKRAISGISLRFRFLNNEINRRICVANIVRRISTLKWNWAGHIGGTTGPRKSLKRSRGIEVSGCDKAVDDYI